MRQSLAAILTSPGREPAFNGNYILTALVAVSDARFWEKFSAKMQSIWEHRHGEPFMEVASRNTAELRDLLVVSSWSSDALFAFAEGLLGLKRRFPDHVSLPDIERLAPELGKSK